MKSTNDSTTVYLPGCRIDLDDPIIVGRQVTIVGAADGRDSSRPVGRSTPERHSPRHVVSPGPVDNDPGGESQRTGTE
jgi:hypothetical protein